jgi:hypothetical protein
MDYSSELETAVWQFLLQHRICSMDELFRNLPSLTANQMFLTVDRLSREGKVLLHYQNRAEYVIVRPGVVLESPCEKSSGTMIGYPF